MEYIILFFEGIFTFVSPCLLPMLPIYILYFMGEDDSSSKNSKVVLNSIFFVAGFTTIFVILGAFAGVIGKFLILHKTAFNFVTGLIVIIFGLNFLGIIKIGFLNKSASYSSKPKITNFTSAFLFGMVFSINWTPCVTAFLGSALTIASTSKNIPKSAFMLFCYSLGLGIPFIISAILLDKLKSAFDFIKKHYNTINKISGALLIVMGILIITGNLDKLLAFVNNYWR